MDIRKIVRDIKDIALGKKVVVIVQCRLSSTRLPGKALKKLGDKTVLEWTLNAMKKVKATSYYLATDEDSKTELEPIARKCGWDFFAGSLNDVLDRFCRVIEISKADVVVRATADNPFLFYDAANDLVEEYFNFIKMKSPKDYITYSGLPHGSGVEMFNAHSLLEARKLTDLPYDHEHVGPALYNHRDRFNCEFIPAPRKYNFPDYRTTIDTAQDYRRASFIVDSLSSSIGFGPYSTNEILNAMELSCVKYPVMLIPSCKKGRGTGHLRRCLDLALKNSWVVYVPENNDLEQSSSLVEEYFAKGLKNYQIAQSLDDIESFSLCITDMFKTEKDFALSISDRCPVIALDDGSDFTDYADYLLDVIPTLDSRENVNLYRPSLIPLPENRRKADEKKKIENSLVVLGGEDPLSLTVPAVKALCELGIRVRAVVSSEEIRNALESEEMSGLVEISAPVENLREKLFEYDLVVTHFGFTAFEARGAGCNVILLATSDLHGKLSQVHGFECLNPREITAARISKLIAESKKILVPNNNSDASGQNTIESFTKMLSFGKHLSCPVCRDKCKSSRNPVVARIPERTFRKCSECGMTYISFSVEEKETEYNRAYFFEDYEKQYGKTYLDDFDSIKKQCVRRISVISMLYKAMNGISSKKSPSVLDIGCAMGPFLDAANDASWQVFGADVSRDAVEYVSKKLNYPAVCGPFPHVDLLHEFGVEKFDAITMWYVIEHFQDLNQVLEAVSRLVKKDGIFAFSTPSLSGVTGKFSTRKFFAQSPGDHYSLWEVKNASRVLKKYGFEVLRIVPTGIHPERFPFVQNRKKAPGPLLMKFLAFVCRIFKWGDTFEVYARKISY